MSVAVVLRHLAFEDLGLFEAPLRALGYRIEVLDAGVNVRPERLRAADLLVVCGGPIGAYETELYPFLADEIRVIAQRLAGHRPTLGICLGAQLMATAMGARVYPGTRKELGWAPLQLTEAGCASPLAAIGDLPVLHWHGDTFDLPKGATLLASTPDTPHQAFSVGRHGLALQFHLEADPARIEQWLVGHTGELKAAGINIPALRAASAVHGPRLVPVVRSVVTHWLDAMAPRRTR
ncbi:glutamine amidotransferase [Nitrogeniibacter mangrovi]|uniref:Glutamine amidotransferase n=1 Tax=Nitrogeniibacter mangrovi TaxID=2016596 RepID=A0A6C1B9S6_9RHOO|nr:glutamine amidotransferase [Nitrogeniibacter mangrovi]QID19615.1 glutamine amidotransferase [Nitrogeniibacter mangrovi]